MQATLVKLRSHKKRRCGNRGANRKEETGQWEWDGTRQGDRGEYDRNNL